MITQSWHAVQMIAVGDWCVAYLEPRTFYAVGEVIEPRQRPTFYDSVDRTLRERWHAHYEGVVRYRDAPTFYEDFTDDWVLHMKNTCSGKEEPSKYPERVDVKKWTHIVYSGIQIEGLKEAAINRWPSGTIIPVHKWFFDEVAKALQRGSS